MTNRTQKILRLQPRMTTNREPDLANGINDAINDAIIDDEPLSNCCEADFLEESDLCSKCKEHAHAEVAVWINSYTSYLVSYDPVTRDEIESILVD